MSVRGWKLQGLGMGMLVLGVVSCSSSSPIRPSGGASLSSLSGTIRYISPAGSDNNPGTLSSPYKTIQKCATISGAGDTCLIRAGIYRETVTPAASGVSGAPITFSPYNGETVTISGADMVDGWTADSGGAYKTDAVSWDLGVGANQVFLDGVMMIEARWPNLGTQLSQPERAVAQSVSGNTIIDARLSQTGSFWTGGYIHLTPADEWIAQTERITGISGNAVTFTYTNINGAVRAGNHYYLFGKREALDAPSEWFLETSSTIKTLYLRSPNNDNPNNHITEVKRRLVAFDMSNRQHITLNRLNFFAAGIKSSPGSGNLILDGISSKYGWHATVVDAASQHPWSAYMTEGGIVLDGSNNVLRNSTIAFSAGNCVALFGRDGLITNNIIHDCNYNAMATTAINTYPRNDPNHILSSNIEISYNTIFNTGRHTLEFGKSTNTFIHHNDLYFAGLQTSDVGTTGVYQTDGGGILAYNLAHDGFGESRGNGVAAGIYLDNGSNNFAVHHNVMWGVKEGLRLNGPSRNNTVYNNTVIGDDLGLMSYGNPTDWTNTTIRNNIFTKSLENTVTANLLNNLFEGTDPQFVNPGKNDYRLQASSPANPNIGAYESGATSWTAGATMKAAVPLVVGISAPGDRTTHMGTLTITVRAYSPSGVDRVEFYSNGTLISTDTEAPYRFSWTSAPAGAQVLTARAFAQSQSVTSTPVSVEVQGSTSNNIVENASFENGATNYGQTLSNWTSSLDVTADYTETTGGAHTGSFHGTHYKDTPYEVYTSQTLSGIQNGTYTVSAWVKSSGGQTYVLMDAKNCGGAIQRQSIPASTTWVLVTLTNVSISAGQCTIGFYSNASGGQWLHFDDVQLQLTAGSVATNLVANPSFEINASNYGQTISSWSSNSANVEADYTETYGGGHSGAFHGTHYKGSAYEVYTSQTIGNLSGGMYTLRAWVKSSGGQTYALMDAKNCGGNIRQQPIGASAVWSLVTLTDINVSSNTCTIGFYSYAAADQWLYFDDVEFIKN